MNHALSSRREISTPKRNLVLKSGVCAAVLSLFAGVVLFNQQPVLIEAGEDAVLSVGLRLNQYAPVKQMPPWLELPDRSTVAYTSVRASADNSRVHFRSLLSSGAIENHFRQLLIANGFQLALIRPVTSDSAVSSVITAFDDALSRSVRITVRRGKAVRSVEMTFSGPAQIASKGSLIDS